VENFVKFFIEIGKLKFTKRKWYLHGIPKEESESVTDHAFRLALMSWHFSRKRKLDTARVLKISLVHDLCNVYLGEYTPYDKVLTGDQKKDDEIMRVLPRFSKADKERSSREQRDAEERALDKLLSILSNDFGEEIKELWNEYERQNSPEGRFVRQVDQIERLLQALEYNNTGKLNSVNPFWFQVKEWLYDKELIEFIESLDDHFYEGKAGKTHVEKSSN